MTEPTDAEQYLNVADQCSATATSELAASILVDGGSGTLRQLLNDAADAIRAGWSTPQPTQPQAGPISGAKSFQTYAEANAYSKGYYAGKKAAKQPQAEAVPMTPEQRDALWESCKYDDGEEWTVDWEQIVDAVERHHRIGIKGGQYVV